jgi:hypothetical protein
MLERDYSWRGILVEAIPTFYNDIILKRRKALLLNICLSPRPKFETVIKYDKPVSLTCVTLSSFFLQIRMIETKKGTDHEKSMSAAENTLPTKGKVKKIIQVDCYPIYDVLSACNMTTLDILFLDIQGPEYDVLSTIPWNLVNIKAKLTFSRNLKF